MSEETPLSSIPFPIAIVGMGMRFPGGASTPESYWKLLLEGRQTAKEVPPERWDQTAFYDADPERPGKGYLNRASFLDEDIRAFDARFFGILPREAATMDPQIRLTLEVVWEAFEQAGLQPADFRGEGTGVYLSSFVPDYFLLSGQNFNAAFADPWHATGISLAMIANRVSFSFDFRGPSMTVDTACSGSHSAIYLACQEMWRGATQFAVAGGVSLIAYPNAIASLCRARFLSPDGTSKPFDARADGYGKGEGAGVVLLCPLDMALERGFDIHGLIVGASANQDGRTDGITVPSLASQKSLIETAWRRAGLSLARASYVEAHGTGTAVGDPIEARALAETFGASRANGDPCLIGSVKGNIGHTEAAAGIASIIKVLLSLKHGLIPKQAGFETPNPQIPFADWKLRLPIEPESWPAGDEPRVAGINGFGYGGSNCHLVIQEPPRRTPRKNSAATPESALLPISARSTEALRSLAADYGKLLREYPLADVCAAAATRRAAQPLRAAFVGNAEEISAALEKFATEGGSHASSAVGIEAGDLATRRSLLEEAGKLFVAGGTPDWPSIYPEANPMSVPLPYYPWQREVHWFSTPGLRRWTHPANVHPLLGQRSGPLDSRWTSEPTFTRLPWLRDHCVSGQPVFPAAGFLEMMFAAARESSAKREGPLQIEKISFPEALLLKSGPYPTLHSEIDDSDRISIRSENIDAAGAERAIVHARARLVTNTPLTEKAIPASPIPVDASSIMPPLNGAQFRETLAGFNLQYGPAFQGVEAIRFGGREAFASVQLAESIGGDVSEWLFHPCLLDLCFQTSLSLCGRQGIPRGNWLPVSCERITYFRSPGSSCQVWSKVDDAGDTRCVGNILVTDAGGSPCLQVEGLTLRRIGEAKSEVPPDWFYEDRWRRSPAPAAASAPATVWAPGGTRWLKAFQEAVPGAVLDTGIEPPSHPELVICEYGAETNAEDGAGWTRAVAEAGGKVLGLARSLLPFGTSENPLRLVFLTRGALRVHPSDPAPHLLAASLWGVFRSLMKERADLDILAVDLPSDPAQDPPEEMLVDYFLEEPLAREAAWRHGEFLLREVVQFTPGAIAAAETCGGGSGSAQLDIGSPGHWDSLDFRAARRRAPQGDEIEVRVSHAALNYKDALKVSGLAGKLIEVSASGALLGLECSGVVERAGPAAAFQPGDAVLCWGVSGSFQTFVTLPDSQAVALPPGLTLECGGAQIPLLTAWRALIDLARLEVGETVLIHSAAGGVGHYAVEIALAIGARVFATAGTEAKRAHLLSQGAAAVFDSRTLDFAAQIRRETGGRGVDVVLNSLTGEALAQSFGLLAPHGRFVEIGKRDILEGRPLDLSGFHRNASFFAVDLDQPDEPLAWRLRDSLREALKWVSEGRIRLPKLEAFAASDAAAAFRKMAAAGHIGRLALRFDPPPQHPAPPRLRGRLFPPDRTYLVTGGLGEVGFALVRWLAESGAGPILIVGRTAPGEDRQRDLAELIAKGTGVYFYQADIARPEDCARLSALFEAKFPPPAGIFHAAGIVQDALIETMGESEFAAPLEAKVAGAWNLHLLAVEHDVDHFVLMSSIASSWGSPGQTNYAAGNAFQDALAERRLHDGLPAISVNFGPFSGPRSMAQRFERADEFFKTIGLPLMPPSAAGAALTSLLRAGRRRATVADVNWTAWIQGFPREARGARFEQVTFSAAGEIPKSAAGSAAARIQSASGENRLVVILEALRELLARETQMPLAQIDPDSALRELGIDSLSSVAIDIRIRETFGVTIPFLQLFQEPSLRAIAVRIATRLDEKT